jgi:hypothetical protein
MESLINMESLLGLGPSVWRPVAESEAVVMRNGLPFLGKGGQATVMRITQFYNEDCAATVARLCEP